jgi:hypothetical protein
LEGQFGFTKHASLLGVQDHILEAINPLTVSRDQNRIEYVIAKPSLEHANLGGIKPQQCTEHLMNLTFETTVAYPHGIFSARWTAYCQTIES